MNVTKKKRPAGRPRNPDKPAPRTVNFRQSAVQTLAALTERYGHDAPFFFPTVTDRTVLEALIYYADREKIPFEVLFGVTADARGS